MTLLTVNTSRYRWSRPDSDHITRRFVRGSYFLYPQAGRRVATSSPSLQTEHIHNASGDINDDFSPVDAIVAVDYALYVAEHMQLALYNPTESYLPAAAAARLARHIAELADEHSALEIVFERFFARDQEEAEQVSLTRGI